MVAPTPNKHGLYTCVETQADDLHIFQSDREFGFDPTRRLTINYSFRPRVLHHFFQYCKQTGQELPFADTWEAEFYDSYFPGLDRENDLRKADVHWRLHIPEADGSDLATLLEKAKAVTRDTVWGTPQRFDRARKVYPLISREDLTYVETIDEGRTYRQILVFDSTDLQPMIRHLTTDCRRRGHENIPGWLFLTATGHPR